MPFLFVPVQYLEHQGSDPLLEVSGGHQPCPRYTPALLACIARKARCLAAFAVARGWAATAEVRGAAAAGRYPRLTGCRCHLKLQLPSTFYKCNSSPHLPTLQLLLPAVSADGASAAQAVALMDACCPDGLTLLHLAVGTGSVELLGVLAAWGAAGRRGGRPRR